MSDPGRTLHQALSSRGNRRRATQAIIAAAGSLLLLEAATHQGSPLAFAQDDEDNSGHGRGRGRGGDDQDNSGPGNAEDAEDPAEAAEEPAEAAAEVELQAESLEVRIVGDDAGDFVPGELTVDVGQSVTFVNVHSDEHTATGSGFDTGIIPDEGGTATVVLDTPGVFPYACQIHPEMTGVIRVRDENGVVPETQTTAQEVPADATTVVIANLAFDPSAITVPTGTTVAWTNEDSGAPYRHVDRRSLRLWHLRSGGQFCVHLQRTRIVCLRLPVAPADARHGDRRRRGGCRGTGDRRADGNHGRGHHGATAAGG